MQALTIAEQLVEQINLGVFNPGEKLPSERNLSVSFNCNRLTLQESLSYLEAQGYIYSEKRKGWFIAEPALKYRWYPKLVCTDFKERYLVDNTQQLELLSQLNFIKATAAANEQAQILKIAPLSPIYHIEYLHYYQKHPVMVSVHYCTKKYFNKLAVEPPIDGLQTSLYRSYQELYHDNLVSKTLLINHCAFPSLISEQLLAPKSTQALRLTHFIHQEEAAKEMPPIEVSYEYWRAHALNIELS